MAKIEEGESGDAGATQLAFKDAEQALVDAMAGADVSAIEVGGLLITNPVNSLVWHWSFMPEQLHFHDSKEVARVPPALSPDLLDAVAQFRACMERIAELAPGYEDGDEAWTRDVWWPACRAHDAAQSRVCQIMEDRRIPAVVVSGRLYIAPFALLGWDSEHPPTGMNVVEVEGAVF
jgi:hypothetical protein